MTGLDTKLQWDQEQRNTGDQGALENKKEILECCLETKLSSSQVFA